MKVDLRRPWRAKAILIGGILLLCSLGGAEAASAQSWSNGYAHRRAITIDHTRVPNTDQSNFPLLLSGTYSDLATVPNGGSVTNSNGYDIVFTSDSAGTTVLPFEQETFSATTGAVDYWIQIPTLSHTADTVIYMFYGNSSITTDQSNKNGVWDSNYKGVWHLDQAPTGTGSILDSTSNGYNGTPASSGISLSSTGIAGGSLNFDGVSNGNDVTFSSSTPGGPPITASIWIKTTGLNSTAQSQIMAKFQWSSSGWGIYDDGQYDANVFLRPYPNYNNVVDIPRSSINNGVWHYLVGTIDPGDTLRFYLDGALYGSTTTSSTTADTTDALVIGGFGGGAGGGLLTEGRVSNSVRSADWIAAEYNNQQSPSSFYTMGFADSSNGYSYRSAITIDHTKVSNTDQTDFPVLVSGTYSYLATTGSAGNVTNSNGYDIIFTSDASGMTPLSYERETYNATTGAINFWVKVPTVSHTTDTVIYMFYGNSSVTTDQSNAAGVWDSNYRGVWHMGSSSTLSGADSTSNGYTLTNNNSTTATSGFINGAASFNGTNNYLSNSSLSIPAGSPITVSYWNYVTSADVQSSAVFTIGASDNPNRISEHAPWSDNNLYWDYGSWSGGGRVTQNYSSYLGSWTYVVSEYDASSNTHSLYLNGSLVASNVNSNVPTATQTGIDIGAWATAGVYQHGNIDEFRVSTTARSADRVATEYVNQNNPSAFFVVGASTTAPHLASLLPTSGPTGTSVTITGTNFGSTQGSSTVTFTGVAAAPTSWSDTQIVVPVPTGTISGSVVVTVSSVGSNSLAFTDTSISITRLAPASGPISTAVTILGANFGSTQGSSTVNFNGTTATPTSWTNSQIVAPVPGGATTGNVTVSLTSGASNGAVFTVTAPTISALSTSSGPTGTSVTISGSSFGLTQSQGSSTVTFNGAAATPTIWSPTSIVVPVPTAATTGNVVVTVAGVASNGVSFSVVPSITSLSPLSGLAGTSVTIAGTGFEATQGSSTVTFNGASATPTSWSDTSIVVPVPSGATKGNVVVSVGGFNSVGAAFDILPVGWLDQDVGNVGLAGSATYSNGIFTVSAGGTDIYDTADGMHFVYQQLSGDGTIVARVVNLQGGGSYSKAGVMIRETLTAGSANAYSFEQSAGGTTYYFSYRPTTSGSTTQSAVGGTVQNWVKVTRSGNTLSGYVSPDAVNWTQMGSSQTISMATNVYVGLAVTSENTSSLATAKFDNVSISTPAAPAPVITGASATTGNVGTQVVVTGTGFGASQGSSLVLINDIPQTINSWSAASISMTIPTGPTSGDLVVCVGPSLDCSNPVAFNVTANPLPSTWLDQDVGYGGAFGSATYASSTGTFAVNGAGVNAIGGTGDIFHFVYQPLSGDSTIVTRVTSLQAGTGGSTRQAGIMIRETLTQGSAMAFLGCQGACSTQFIYRTATDANATTYSGPGVTLPYWYKLVRSGSTFTAYMALDGVNWTQVGSSQTISMATNVYVGLAVDSVYIGGVSTGTFDNVSVSSGAVTAPVITSVSATTASVGSQVVITGTGFGSSQNGSAVFLNDFATTIVGWSDTSIVITIPTGATSGYLAVSVAPTMNTSNPVPFEVTAQPLPSPWLDQDIGSVGIAGNATYASGTFTVTAAGNGVGGTGDGIHFVYQPLSGDGTIVARLASFQQSSYAEAGVMIRETLSPGATMAFVGYQPANGSDNFKYRTTTGGTAGSTGVSTSSLPTWLMVIRSGNTFKVYTAPDGVNWTQVGSTQTINMATNVYVGLAVASSGNYFVATAGFDNVAVSSSASVISPVISSLSPPGGPVGGSITVNGTSFGTSQSSSQLLLNGAAVNPTSWSSTSIGFTVPNGATTGPITVTVGGVTSNAVQLTVLEAGTVTALSPSSGPIGSSVVITGTGFGSTQSTSVVFFAADVSITIASWSDTSITATVPAGTVTGPVTVTVAGKTATGPVFTLTAQIQLVDSLGHSTTYTSQVGAGRWLPTDSQGSACSTCSVRGDNHNTYDSNGNILTSTDPLGHVTTYTYDSSNNMLSQSTPLNGTTNATTSYTYNGFGEVLTVTDPLGNVTTNTYDTHGNLTSVTSPAPNSGTAASVTTFAYNSLGELTSITDPLNHVTTMAYTTAGLIATITDAQNNVTTYAYDLKGNRTSVTDALNHQTTFTYDAMSRLTKITYPDSTTSSFTYDSRGRRTAVTDQNNKTTTYAYDDSDRLTSVTDAASHVTHYAYDTEDNLSSITDANSNQTAFTYDAFGRVTQTNFPSSLSEFYQYDADNNLTQKTDRKNQTITYVYDALNRLSKKQYPDSTEVDYTYDLVGKIQQVNDPTGTYAFAYDNMGRLIGTTTSYSFLTSRSFTNAYTYDAVSNRTGFTDPESGSTTYSYDTLNRLTSLAPPSAFGSGSFGFSYDALSRRTQMTRPNSVTTNYAYDNLSHLTSVLHQLSGSTIDGASYTLDNAGNRTSKMDQLAGVTSNYTYDPLYQLTQVTQANNTTESYSYDAVGNRTASLGVSSYTTNASNELTATSNASYTYDGNGNTLTKTVGSNTTTYAWDNENRLTSVTLPGSSGTVTFKYDPFGRRVYKSSSLGTSVFEYDGDNLIEETNSSGTVVARYSQTGNVDEPLAMLHSSGTSYYHEDGLGSVTSLTNSSGAGMQTYTSDSFGKPTASSGSITNPFQYASREYDSEIGLYYYRARYFDFSTGRFISEDPIGFGGDADFYSYVTNDPTDYFDPFGFQKQKSRKSPVGPVDPCPKDKRCFFNWLDGPLGQAAQDLHTTKALMLTMAAKEGGWTQPALDHNMPLNNPFGVNNISKGKAIGNKRYPTLPSAIQDWERMYGGRVGGTQSPDDFVYGLQHPDPPGMPYNSVHADTYEDVFQNVYDAVVRFMKLCGINQ